MPPRIPLATELKLKEQGRWHEVTTTKPKSAKKTRISEDDEQALVIEWANDNIYRHPELELLYHPPNGGKRHMKTAKMLKRIGAKSGVPDLCLPVPRKGFASLYIEMKALDGVPSVNQLEWIEKLKKYNNMAVICYGNEEAIKTLEEYLNGKADRINKKAQNPNGRKECAD